MKLLIAIILMLNVTIVFANTEIPIADEFATNPGMTLSEINTIITTSLSELAMSICTTEVQEINNMEIDLNDVSLRKTKGKEELFSQYYSIVNYSANVTCRP